MHDSLDVFMLPEASTSTTPSWGMYMVPSSGVQRLQGHCLQQQGLLVTGLVLHNYRALLIPHQRCQEDGSLSGHIAQCISFPYTRCSAGCGFGLDWSRRIVIVVVELLETRMVTEHARAG